jgi:uncharacterized protein YhaN
MRFSGWNIDAFGGLRDVRVEGLGPGMNLVVGPNESGKTTTMHFLRWTLFGYPHHANLAFKRYRPATGKFGGRATIDLDGRPVIVERFAGQTSDIFLAASGAPCTDLARSDLVGTADLHLFESVFAIGVDELQSLERLDSDVVRERIYGASVMGSGRSARDALAELDSRRKTLLSPRTGRIRDLRKALQDTTDQLAEARSRAASLGRQRRDVESLADAVATARADNAAIALELAHAAKLKLLWPTWSDATNATAELETMAEPTDLGPDPIGRLDRLRGDCQRAAAAEGNAEAVHRAAQTTLGALPVDDALAAVAHRIRELQAQLPVQAAEGQSYDRTTSEVERHRQVINARIRNLGIDLDRERLAEVDTSAGATRAVGDFADSLDSAAQARRSAELERGPAMSSLETVQAELAEAKDQLDAAAAPLGPLHDIDAAHQATLELRELLPRLGAAQMLAGRQAEEDARLRAMVGELAARNGDSPTLPGWMAPVALALAVVLALAGFTGLITGSPVPGAAALLGAAALATIGTVLLRAGRVPRSTIPSTQVDLTATSAGANDQTAKLEAAARRLATVAGLGDAPTTLLVDRRLGELEAVRQAHTRIHALQQRRARTADLVERADRTLDDAAKADDDAHARWIDWLASRSLPPELRPSETLALFDQLRSLVQMDEVVRGLETRQSQARASIDAFEAELAGLLHDLGDRGPGAPVESHAALIELTTRLDADELARRRREDATTELERAADLLTAVESRRLAAEQELDDWFRRVGVDDEAGLRALAVVEARRAELESAVSDTEQRLQGAFGAGGAAERARTELDKGDLEGWEALLAGGSVEQADADRRFTEAVRAQRDAEQALDDLEASADVPRLSLEAGAMRAELEECLAEWAVLSVAQQAIASTLQDFERDRQPAVVSRAAEAFARITDQRYKALVPRSGSLELLLSSDARLDSQLLSRGATEQLYLCMRLALAQEYAATTRLPLLLDDVLVDADPARRARMAAELARVAEELQVIMFTCQDETAELLAAASPDAVIVELDS